MKTVGYEIVTGTSFKELASNVSAFLSENVGWEPHGNVVHHEAKVGQPMVKVEYQFGDGEND